MPDNSQSRDYQRVAAAIRYIEEHATQQPSLAQVAARLELSPSHIQRLFRRWAGVTPKQFLQLITLEHARQLLMRDHSVLDASLAVGLSSPARLHDHFVTIEAVSPGEFKAKGAGLRIDWGISPSPFGEVFVARSARGICQLAFVDADFQSELRQLRQQWSQAELCRNDRMAVDTMTSVFDGRDPKDEIRVWVRGTNFQLQVWRALLKIPQGEVTSYSQVAESVGRGNATRAVASAIAANPVGYLIPCHRVLRKSGDWGGYRWQVQRKKALLGWESAKTVHFGLRQGVQGDTGGHK